MRYAVFSDIHANRQAWEAVREDMRDLQVQVFVCLGDIVGYGPRPQEVLEAVRSCSENVVMGNHDAAASGQLDPTIFNPRARQAIEWTREHLDEEARSFLGSLPGVIESEDLFFVHAEAEEPGRFNYIDDVEIAKENFAAQDRFVTFVGHTHHPTLFCLEPGGEVRQLPDADCDLDPQCRYIVNVGSVGEPRSFEDIRARYVIYDADRRKLYFRRIAFDVESYRADWMEAGLEVTPFFLTVADRMRSEYEAAMQQGAAPQAGQAGTAGGFGGVVSELVLPSGLDAERSSESMPVPEPTPARQPHHPKVALLLIPLVAMLLAVAAFWSARQERLRSEEPSPFVVKADPGRPRNGDPVAGRPENGPPTEAEAREPSRPASDPDETDPATEVIQLPSVVVQPVQPSPPTPPAPASVPPDAAPPTGEEVVAASDLSELTRGLLCYVSFDEPVDSTVAFDRSAGGRHFDVEAAMLGHPGKVGTALWLQRPLSEVLSTGAGMPDLSELTVSLWFRLPDGAAAESLEGNLLSVRGYADIRLEQGQLVADLDREGEVARLGLPGDQGWHHLLVEHGPGLTMIWIDNASASEPVGERLKPWPGGESVLQLGSPQSDFLVDEVAIWGRRFAPAERDLLYRRGVAGSPLLSPAPVVAQWNFDEEDGARLFEDPVGGHALGAYKGWQPVEGIAPNPVPLTMEASAFAAQVRHVAEDPEKAGTFVMKRDAAFTYEGWVKFSGGHGGTLGGTVTEGEEGGTGWCLAVRRDRGANGFVAFIHESGAEKVQALAREVPIFDGFPHHFAAVWHPDPSGEVGEMRLFVDNALLATAQLPLERIDPGPRRPFRIQAGGTPFVIDQVRFSAGPLQPGLFLTSGISSHPWSDPFYESESLLERRDRELREWRRQQKEERDRAEAERAAREAQ